MRWDHHPGLDGLRGLAVLGVLLFHANLGWAGGGFLGVSVFFTLSGFLITVLLLQEHGATGRIDRRSFWLRRGRRLLPAALVTLLGVCLMTLIWPDLNADGSLRDDVISSLFYVANWRFISDSGSYADLFAGESPLLHFWSLAIEEQFYLLYPVLLGAISLGRSRRGSEHRWWTRHRSTLLLGVTSAAAFAWTFWLSHQGPDPDRLYFGTDTRIAELLAGATLAAWMVERGTTTVRHDRRTAIDLGGIAGLLALAFLTATIDIGGLTLFRGPLLMTSVATVLAICATVQPSGLTRRLLGATPLGALGRISYAVYLFHWPLFVVLRADAHLDGTMLLAVGGSGAIALAALSSLVIEQPIRRGRRLTRTRPALTTLVACVATVTLVAVVLPVGDAAEVLDLLSDAEEERADPPAPPPEVDRAGAEVSDQSPNPVVLLVGDSMAASVAPNLLDALKRDAAGFSIEVVSTPTCAGPGQSAALGCPEWIRTWGDRANQIRPAAVIVAIGATPAADLLSAGGPEPTLSGAVEEEWLRSVLELSVAPLVEIAPVTLAPPEYNLSGSTDRTLQSTAQVLQAQVGVGISQPSIALYSHPDPASEPFRRGVGPQAAGLQQWSDDWATGVVDMLDLDALPTSQDEVERIMVVGDSVSWFVGRSLQEWSLDRSDVTAWNTGTLGCGIARGGIILLSNGDTPTDPFCDAWEERWSDQLTTFDPDTVVILTGLWEFTDRRPAEGQPYQRIGEPVFDDWLIDELVAATSLLASTDADIVWLTTPCHADAILPGPLSENPALDRARYVHFNTVILPEVVEATGSRLIDLDALVCPGGQFTQELNGLPGSRPDGVHFSVDAADYIATWLGPQLLSDPADANSPP